MSTRAEEAFRRLRVIDRLEVGPPRLSGRRLVCPYTVVIDGEAQTFDLAFRYERDVFDPESLEDSNLAAMISSQVALNYGLFCGELVFRGVFDESDRRFLSDMASNTAREIYVKRFLQPNEFLVGDATELSPSRHSTYLNAELVFADEPPVHLTSASWRPDHSRHVVLSSGGKDSLLSFGLLEEDGRDVHSLFVNESGRHWYTALNAYRHLSVTRPASTGRVWSNCDRAFNWMLRKLPFVRPDYARIRSDEYPIRLWTVAVFLFGVLPVARARGIGRIVIGDEHDTTRRASHAKIPHFDGLYDQSRFFDRALSTYYRRKGWGLSQFSLVRPLSEMLVQKTLVERYPELQRHQVSCHAAHVVGDRVKPCGRCEKCRRIVGMLVAVDADPGACGYTAEQIDDCLTSLAERGVHQESAAAEHTGWMLAAKGLVPAEARGMGRLRERPEIMQLRFHQLRSPVDSVPNDLRSGLYRRLLDHAAGAVQWVDRQWVPFDPLSEEALGAPYRAESRGRPRGSNTVKETTGAPVPRPGKVAGEPSPAKRSDFLLGEMSWPRARDRLRMSDTVLLPVGAVEQHGPHLPLDTDAWDAEHICQEVAARCSEPRPLVLPLIPYGVSYHHEEFPGTLSVSPRSLSSLVYDVGMSAARHGVKKLLIINGHGGNAPALQYAAQMVNRDAHIFTCVDTGETSDYDIAKIAETADDVHAGEIETSTTLATRPDLVDMSSLRRHVPRYSTHYLRPSSTRSVPWYAHTGQISPSGVLGDPTRASREKGEELWRVMIDRLVEFVEAVKGRSIEELHERRL